MPLVKPQIDDGWEEVVDLIQKDTLIYTTAECDRIKHFLNVRPWNCMGCGAVVFGRSLKCACGNRRPDNFVLEPR